MKKFLLEHKVKILVVSLILYIAIIFIFRKQVIHNKYTKAKLDFFKGMYNQDTDEMKHAFDSIIHVK